MYCDIFFAHPLAVIASEPDSETGGVVIELPGPLRAVVTAASERGTDSSVKHETGFPLAATKGYIHCLVTDEQLDVIEADNVPYFTFATAPGWFKRNGCPSHVYNPAGVVSRVNGKHYLYAVGSSTPVLINGGVE